jgi:hypothetical protein
MRMNPLECDAIGTPLVEGELCGDITGVGCCDANGDLWYCGFDLLVHEPCE